MVAPERRDIADPSSTLSQNKKEPNRIAETRKSGNAGKTAIASIQWTQNRVIHEGPEAHSCLDP